MSDSQAAKESTTSLASKVNQGANGREAPSYDSRVSSPGTPSKEELQAKLELASSAISDRLQSIQDELGGTTKTLQRFFGSPLIGVLAALGAGLVVGRMFSGSGSRSRSSDPDALADLLAREVHDALDHGEPPEEAIHKVIDTLGLVIDGSGGQPSGSALKWIAGIAARSLLTHGLKAFSGPSTEPSVGEGSAADASDLADL
ncbi:MAG: hypothetical protein KJO98_14700 [Rhodothermia bacterium]|nr:hypothetical protein [Rhodothermia bacterium]